MCIQKEYGWLDNIKNTVVLISFLFKASYMVAEVFTRGMPVEKRIEDRRKEAFMFYQLDTKSKSILFLKMDNARF